MSPKTCCCQQRYYINILFGACAVTLMLLLFYSYSPNSTPVYLLTRKMTALVQELFVDDVQVNTTSNVTCSLCVAMDAVRNGHHKDSTCGYLGKLQLHNITDNSQYIMSVIHQGRLGNNMFQYAALKGMSVITGHNPILSHKYTTLMDIFPNISIPIGNTSIRRLVNIHEHPDNIHDNNIHCLLQYCQGRDVFLHGYFAAHLLFNHIPDEITADFTFSWEIQEAVATFFKTNVYNDHDLNDIVTVGIHFRLTDRATQMHIARNASIMTPSYFFNAMEYYTHKFHNKTVYFILLSDDQAWVRENIVQRATKFKHVIQSFNRSGPVDLAIMAACDHTVISVGSYSWWGAWLSKGTTVYYSGFPRPGIETIRFSGHNYIPPPPHRHNHWIPIGK